MLLCLMLVETRGADVCGECNGTCTLCLIFDVCGESRVHVHLHYV